MKHLRICLMALICMLHCLTVDEMCWSKERVLSMMTPSNFISEEIFIF